MTSLLRLAIVTVTATSCLCGCDYGRRGGTYGLTIQHESPRASAIEVESHDVAELRHLLEQWLSEQGFTEFTGKRTIWQKRGTSVYVWQDLKDQLRIQFSAFGSKRDLRLSEETEAALVAYLEEQPGLKLIPTPSDEQF